MTKTHTIPTPAALAIHAAADRITTMYSDEDAGPAELAAAYAVAVDVAAALLPFEGPEAQTVLDDYIDVILDGWDYNDDMDAAGFLATLAQGLGV